MPVRERREREKLDTRDKILDAARELFVSQGYEGVSMRKIAEAIDYSPTAIYVHFKDKEELFRELCHADFQRLAGIFQNISEVADPVERIRQTGAMYIQFGLEYPNHYKLMFMTPHPITELGAAELAERGNPESDAYAFLLWCVQTAIDAGVFLPELRDPHLIAQTLWAAVHGVISLQIAKASDPWVDWKPVEERAAMMLNISLRGMFAEGN